jgi:hypothetical protein
MARPLQARAMVTVAAWLAAFLIVTVLFLLVGDELQSLPLVPRALIISGVLVGVMVNVVMPRLTVAVGRFDRSRAARGKAAFEPGIRSPAARSRRTMTAGPTTAPLEIVSRRIRAAGVETHLLEAGPGDGNVPSPRQSRLRRPMAAVSAPSRRQGAPHRPRASG